jgi:hypothetical protein
MPSAELGYHRPFGDMDEAIRKSATNAFRPGGFPIRRGLKAKIKQKCSATLADFWRFSKSLGDTSGDTLFRDSVPSYALKCIAF